MEDRGRTFFPHMRKRKNKKGSPFFFLPGSREGGAMTAIDKGRASLSVLFCTQLEIYFILGDGGWMDMFVYVVGEKSLLRGLSS